MEAEIRKISESDVDLLQKAFKRKEKKRSELRAELNAYQEKFAADIKVKCEAALKIAKKNILRYMDDSKEEFVKDVKREFANRRAIQLTTMEQLIGQSVINKIEIKKKEIEILENKMKDAINERDSSVEKLCVQLEGVNGLMKKALDLASDINSIRVDMIKEQTI